MISACTTRSTGGAVAELAARRVHDDRLDGPTLPELAATRQVIAVEQQGHGRTADVDRPLTDEQMADDTSALLRHLEVSKADVVGYSTRGGRRSADGDPPVRKLVVASASFTSDGMHAAALVPVDRTRARRGSPIEEAYLQTAPNPGDFPKLVESSRGANTTPLRLA